MKGSVVLVGAGPGDPGLLTLRAVQALQQADVVLADHLLGPGVLALIPASARVVQVGKRSGNHTIPQEEINRLMQREAAAGNRVVRLKGGDPYLFGRGAEELEALTAANISVEVIPGISSALAVPAWAGIPVTHREYSSSVHIVTGHARDGKKPELPYNALVAQQGTLVFLMGVGMLVEITEGLLHAGIPHDTPAALIQNGTRYNQRKLVATVSTLVKKANEAAIGAPAVLVVGQVCALSNTLDWVSRQPLAGLNVLITRPSHAGSAMADQLQALGCSVIPFPCIRTEARTNPLGNINPSEYDWIVFTSAFGVEVFFKALLDQKKDIRSLAGVRFAVVGSRTAQELEHRGVLVDCMPEQYDGANLARAILKKAVVSDRILLFRAARGEPELSELLRAGGISFNDLAAYDTIYESPAAAHVTELLLNAEIPLVSFTSASTVEGFVQAVGEHVARTAPYTGICIGASTARAAEAYGINVVTSQKATLESMVDTILEYKDGMLE